MKKKHAIGRFIVLAVICTILLALTVFSFSLPGDKQDYDFVGFAREINLGIEYQGGTVKEYTVENNSTVNSSLQTGITNNVTRFKYLLDNDGYNTNVYQNCDNIVIEFFDEYSPMSIDEPEYRPGIEFIGRYSFENPAYRIGFLLSPPTWPPRRSARPAFPL